MNDQLTIRRGVLTDAAAISSLIHSLSHHRVVAPTGPAPESFLALFAPGAIESYIQSPSYDYFVSESDSALVGVIGVRDNTQLVHFFVAAQFQRRGVGRALWRRAREESLAAGNTAGFNVRSSVYAIPVYEHFGFEATGPSVEGDGVTYVPMRLALSLSRKEPNPNDSKTRG